MTRDEARKLLGGYATGTLTEAERKLLFDAALDDQDLFDELAAEQALKELIEEPGVRGRLIAALEPKKQRAWWPWAVAVTMAGLATIAVWVARQPEATQQVAVNTAPAELPSPAPAAPVPEVRKVERAVSAPAAAPPQPGPPSVAAEKAKVADAAPAAAEAIAEQTIQLRADSLGVVAPAPQAAAPKAVARANFVAADASPLTYEFLPSGNLRVTSVSGGTLEVRSGQQVLFEARRIEGNSPVEIAVPAGVQQVRIEFTPPGQAAIVLNAPVPR
ncbi:MAG: hypothetical protein RL328_1592 [Acidobacteriota bacterium]